MHTPIASVLRRNLLVVDFAAAIGRQRTTLVATQLEHSANGIANFLEEYPIFLLKRRQRVGVYVKFAHDLPTAEDRNDNLRSQAWATGQVVRLVGDVLRDEGVLARRVSF